jgi:hypothetical protein
LFDEAGFMGGEFAGKAQQKNLRRAKRQFGGSGGASSGPTSLHATHMPRSSKSRKSSPEHSARANFFFVFN